MGDVAVKVLHVVRRYRPAVGGLENATATLVNALHEHMHVSVISLNRGGSRQSTPNIRYVPYIGSRRFPVPLWIPPQDYDIIHVHGVDGFLETASRLRFWHRTPLVLSSHGAIFHTTNSIIAKKLYWRYIMPSRIRFVHIIANSRHDQRLFKSIGASAAVIPNFVHGVEFPVPNGPPRYDVLFYGRIARHKGLDLLPAVLELAFHELGPLRVVIAGPDWDGTLRRLRNKFSGAYILGEVNEDEKGALLGSSKVIVFPSRYEGFGMALVEALSAGAIVLANNIPAFREVIRHGHNGFLTDFEDSVGTARVLIDILRQWPLLENVRTAARATSATYSQDEIIRKIIKVYDHVVTCQAGSHCDVIEGIGDQ
jgi:alpha-1,3-mannosyltransferase